MKRKSAHISLFTILLILPLIANAEEGYDKACLARCFRTGHECNYCNYQCYKENSRCPQPNYDGDTTCPFVRTPNQGQDNDT